MTLQKTVNRQRQTAGVSAVLGIVIGIAITAAVGVGVYSIYQEQSDVFTISNAIEVRNLHADVKGDTLSITANIINRGTDITGLTVQSIRAGEFLLEKKRDYNPANSTEQGKSYHYDSSNPIVTKVGDANTTSFKTGSVFIQAGEGVSDGESQPFILRINGDGFSDKVNPTDKLTIQFSYKSGDQTLISEPVTTRVKSG